MKLNPYRSVENLRMKSSDLAPKSVKIDDKFRVRSIYTALGLLSIFIDLWKDIHGSWLLLSPVMDHITALEVILIFLFQWFCTFCLRLLLK